MLRSDFGQNHSIRAVILASLDFIETGIAPVELLGFVVECECVRHSDVCLDYDFAVVSREKHAFNARLMGVPVGPVDASAATVDCDTARFVLGAQTDDLLDLARVGHLVGEVDAIDGGVVVTSPVEHVVDLLVSEAFNRALT